MKEKWWQRDLVVKGHLSLKLQVRLSRRQYWKGDTSWSICLFSGSRASLDLTLFHITHPHNKASQTQHRKHTNPDSYRRIIFPPCHPNTPEQTQPRPHSCGGPRRTLWQWLCLSVWAIQPGRKKHKGPSSSQISNHSGRSLFLCLSNSGLNWGIHLVLKANGVLEVGVGVHTHWTITLLHSLQLPPSKWRGGRGWSKIPSHSNSQERERASLSLHYAVYCKDGRHCTSPPVSECMLGLCVLKITSSTQVSSHDTCMEIISCQVGGTAGHCLYLVECGPRCTSHGWTPKGQPFALLLWGSGCFKASWIQQPPYFHTDIC